MNNALLYLGGMLITALAILFAVPRFVDWNSYRGVFEEEASRVLGREVRVGGNVNVRLLPAPFVSFEKLRIADLGSEGGTSIIRVESFTMWLSVPPLLRGVLEAHRVELGRPVVSLSTNEEGGGNWRTLAFSPGAFRFAPKEVALQSVQVRDGAIIVSGPQRIELARLDDINGEVTAEALEGPFKFRGTANWGGTLRHVKLATSKVDADGVLRFKTAIDVAETSNSYVFDGRLSDIKEKPKLEGDLTAKFALGNGPKPVPVTALDPVVEEPSASTPSGAGSSPGIAPPATKTIAPAPAAKGSRSFDLKAKLTGSTTGVALKDIAVSLEAGAMPQLITGEAVFDWANRMRVDLTLASRWLDLDQISPPGQAKVPLEAGRGYFEAIAAALPQEADTNARLEFDQLTLGGEPISNVRLAASRAGGPLELKGVRADLPGGVRLELDGILTPSAKVPRLDGSLFVSGKSLLRFLAWGFANPKLAEERSDGAFSLDGQFALGDGTLALTNAAFEFADTPLAGDLKIELGDQKKLVMAIEGPRIDVAQIGPGLIGLNVLRNVLLGAEAPAQGASTDGAASTPASSVSNLLDPKTADLSLDLKVAELVDGSRVLTDFDANIRLERGSLSIPRLKFSTPQGLSVEADGEARDVPAHPKGAIRGLVSAPNAEAARAFLTLLDADPAVATDLDRVASLAPFRVAGTLQLAGAPTDGSTLSLDGTLGGGRLSATVRLDGDRTKWRTAPLDAQMSLESRDIARVIATLLGAKPIAAEPVPAGQPAPSTPSAPAALAGRAIIKAAGVPADGLLTLIDATGDGLSLGYRGKVRLPAPGQSGADGYLQVAAADARTVLALTGLASPDRMTAGALNGSIHIQNDAGKLRLTSDTLTIGTGILSGEVSLATKDDGQQTIDAKITTNKTTFASLLWPVLGKSTDTDILNAINPPQPTPARGNARQQAEAQTALPAAVWPEQTFDLSPLDKLSGSVDLKIGALEIEPGLTIRNARLLANIAPGTLSVRRLTGDAVGGRMLSHLDIAKAAAGVEVSGALRIDIDSKPLEAVAGTDDVLPPGDAAAFGVSFSGRALSPAAVVSTLTGKGEITIGDATLTGNSPAAVSTVVRAALTGQGPNSGTQLSDAIREALKTGEVKLGKITIPVEIGDGALKLERVRIEMKDGRSTFATAVELATMKIDSEWQIEPKLDGALGATAERAFLPPVTVVYTGKLSQFTDLVPTVSAGSLERELVVRKMELDVGELERLRKLDEQRARDDAVRRKAQDEEQARIEAERRKALEADQERTAPPAIAPNGLPPVNVVPQANGPAPGMNPSAEQGADASGSDITDDTLAQPPQDARPAGEQEAASPSPPVASPSPAAQRPRRKRPVDDPWQPFQQLN